MGFPSRSRERTGRGEPRAAEVRIGGHVECFAVVAEGTVGRRLAGEERADERADDRNHHQKFYERKTGRPGPTASGL